MVRTRDFLSELASEYEKHRSAGDCNGFGEHKKGQHSNDYAYFGESLQLKFEFGDFRVHKKGVNIVVEAEGAGGVTNETKYWFLLENSIIEGTIALIHVYKRDSPDDYESHHRLWEFLDNKMKASLGDRYKAKWMPLRESCYESDFNEIIDELMKTIHQF